MLLVLHKLEEGEELWESRDAPTYFVFLERDAGLKATDEEAKEEESVNGEHYREAISSDRPRSKSAGKRKD